MRPITTDIRLRPRCAIADAVASVCVFVPLFGTNEPCLGSWGLDPEGKGQFLATVRPIVNIVSHCCGVRRKKSISASARLRQPTALLPTGRCHVNVPRENPPCDAAPHQNSSTTCYNIIMLIKTKTKSSCWL